MKFDMHCHTKEGSIDARVDLERYIKTLIAQGFDGMLITDHNSYKGFEKWEEIKDHFKSQNPFTVLKGIEYDTIDAGHFIAILPDEVNCRLLELRGLTIRELEKLVHRLGGILGPAHPYGPGFFAMMHTKTGKRCKELMERFDFVETFNSCIHPAANEKARLLAEKWSLPHIAGSDAHRFGVIGTACTEFPTEIESNNDLIRMIKDIRRQSNLQISHKKTVDTSLQTNVYRQSNLLLREFCVVGYYLYNKAAAAFRFPARRRAKKEFVE